MSDKRKRERKKLMTFTPAYDQSENVLLGYIADLNLLGARVSGEVQLEIDKELTLAIDFHETPETPAVRMSISARVAWCQQEGDTSYYRTGFTFLELSAENKRVIEAVLDRFQFRPADDAHPWAPPE